MAEPGIILNRKQYETIAKTSYNRILELFDKTDNIDTIPSIIVKIEGKYYITNDSGKAEDVLSILVKIDKESSELPILLIDGNSKEKIAIDFYFDESELCWKQFSIDKDDKIYENTSLKAVNFKQLTFEENWKNTKYFEEIMKSNLSLYSEMIPNTYENVILKKAGLNSELLDVHWRE